MLAKFVDGPYDGRWIDNETINRCCTLHPINAVPPRLFLLMPPIEYWEEIVSGQRLKNESNGGKLWPYERIHVGSDVQFHDAASNGRFEAALRGEHPDPYDVFGSHEQLLVTATYRSLYLLSCSVSRTFRSKPVARIRETRIEHRGKDLDDGLLEHTFKHVCQFTKKDWPSMRLPPSGLSMDTRRTG